MTTLKTPVSESTGCYDLLQCQLDPCAMFWRDQCLWCRRPCARRAVRAEKWRYHRLIVNQQPGWFYVTLWGGKDGGVCTAEGGKRGAVDNNGPSRPSESSKQKRKQEWQNRAGNIVRFGPPEGGPLSHSSFSRTSFLASFNHLPTPIHNLLSHSFHFASSPYVTLFLPHIHEKTRGQSRLATYNPTSTALIPTVTTGALGCTKVFF